MLRADSRFAPSQWEMALLCNKVSLAGCKPRISPVCWATFLGNILFWCFSLFFTAVLREPHPLVGNSQVAEMENQSTCRTVMDPKRSCLCRYQICVGWYPCGLKYCHGKDSSGKVVNYRCGIKTCQKCRTFDYLVAERLSCMWDLPELSYTAPNWSCEIRIDCCEIRIDWCEITIDCCWITIDDIKGYIIYAMMEYWKLLSVYWDNTQHVLSCYHISIVIY